MQRLNKIKEKISKKQFIFIVLFSLMITFNGFIFNQIDVMYKNQAEFGVKVKEIIWLFIIVAAVIWLVLTLALSFILYKSNKAFVYTAAVLMGWALASYIQVLFMNKPHLMTVAGTMSARETPFMFISNALIFLAILAVPIFAVYFERKKGKLFTAKLAVLLSIVILGMQLVGVISAAAAAPVPTKNNELYYFSATQQLQLSQNENIVVFVMDRLDTKNTDAVFDSYKDAEDIFDGFTYYKNNISKYPGTFPSVTALLTDKDFDKKISDQKEYLKSSWQDPLLIKSLQDNNYTVNTLMDSASTFYDFKDLKGKIQNIQKVKRKNRKVNGAKFYLAMQSFALIRQSFDVSKRLFRIDSYVDIPYYCVNIKNTPDYFPRTISPNSDLVFYNTLTKSGGGLSTVNQEKTFSFVHLHSSHDPYLYGADLKKPTGKNDQEKMKGQTYGSFKILNEYFDQMKKLGVYENSTIIVLGDHGNLIDGFFATKPPVTSLFIKLSAEKDTKLNGEKDKLNGEKDTKLKIDETSQLSHDNFAASILDIIGESDKKGDKKSYFDIIKNDGIQQDRMFYNVRWTNLNSCTYVCTYKVNGDASLSKSWVKID